VVAIYESPRRTLICFDTRVFYPRDHILWTLWTDFLVLMLNLCTIFSLHRYKISRSQRHQLRITVSFFQPTIIISIFSAEDNNQDFPPPPIGLLLPPWSWWQRLLPVASVISSSLGKDPPILGAETPQRFTAVKTERGTGSVVDSPGVH